MAKAVSVTNSRRDFIIRASDLAAALTGLAIAASPATDQIYAAIAAHQAAAQVRSGCIAATIRHRPVVGI